MTCHDAREWLSALVDDAIDPARRVEIEAHLSTCTECRLELEGLRATVGLLRRVEPARAPAGFVDRVMQRARPTPWYGRVAAWLFLPLSVKVPAEAAAIVVIAGLAILLIDRTPELRDAARVQAPAPPPISDVRPQPPPTSSEQIPEAPPASRAKETRVAPSEKAAPAPPVTRDEGARGASGEQVASGPAPAAPPEPTQTAPAPAAQSPVASQSPQSAVTAQPPQPPSAPLPRPRAAEESPDAKRERGQVERKLSAPSVGRAGAVAARADVAARLHVRDRGAAVTALPDLLSKVGGSETARHRDGSDLVVEVLIPEARYDDFVRALGGLGAWSGPSLRQRVMLDVPYLRIPIRIVE